MKETNNCTSSFTDIKTVVQNEWVSELSAIEVRIQNNSIFCLD